MLHCRFYFINSNFPRLKKTVTWFIWVVLREHDNSDSEVGSAPPTDPPNFFSQIPSTPQGGQHLLKEIFFLTPKKPRKSPAKFGVLKYDRFDYIRETISIKDDIRKSRPKNRFSKQSLVASDRPHISICMIPKNVPLDCPYKPTWP